MPSRPWGAPGSGRTAIRFVDGVKMTAVPASGNVGGRGDADGRGSAIRFGTWASRGAAAGPGYSSLRARGLVAGLRWRRYDRASPAPALAQ